MSKPRSGTYVLIDFDRHRLSAIEADVSRGGLRVVRSCVSVWRDDSVERSQSEVGRWIAASLKDAGIRATRALMAIPRGDVLLKVLELPRAGIESERDVCEAVRLQFSRQLTMSPEDAVIDSMDLFTGADGPMRTVLAGAVHRERLAWYQAVGEAAGLKVAGLQLRSGGIATLVEQEPGPVLVVAPSTRSTEFVVAHKGRVLFARSAELGASNTDPAIAMLRDEPEAEALNEENDATRRVAIEAKRTWMSYRVSQRAEDLDGVVVLGNGREGSRIASACQAMLELPARCLTDIADVRFKREVPSTELAAIQPLLGLGLRAGRGTGGLDFLNPRTPPDTSAGKRQKVLAGVLGVIVVGGIGWLWMQQQITALQDRESALKDELEQLNGEYRQFLGQKARLEHLRRFDAADPDWVGHLAWLSDRLPDPNVSQASSLSLSASRAIGYEGTSFPGGKWTTNTVVRANVAGRVNDRALTLALRERLLAEQLHTVISRGADVADRYDFELLTDHLKIPTRDESAPGGEP